MPPNSGTRPERPLASSRPVREIQPYQNLNPAPEAPPPPATAPESVDAATARLYKGGHGGGRNPAAAVL